MALAGILEIQLMAEMARLTTDMKRAERVVQDSTDKMGKSVSTLESAFGKLGGTLSLVVAFDTVRRLSDDFTKLTAQIRIATHSQAEYAAGLADVRRISTAAQSDLLSTTLLYTRLTNALSQHGATQKQVSNITESVSLGLKAYGATSTEAASAMLQLSQAFGANRLGGEEFRAVSEAMPNMMKILATSMGVPLSALKALSAEGKITSEVMMKAWDNPAVIDALRAQADMTRTITGEMVVFRNNLKMLVGEFMGASGSTSGITSALRLMSDAVLFLGKNLDQVMTILGAYLGYLALLQVKSALAWGQSRLLVLAHTDAIRMDAAVNAAAAEAKVADLAATQAVIAAERIKTVAILQSTLATKALVVAELQISEAQLAHALSSGVLSGNLYMIRTIEAELVVIRNALTIATNAQSAATTDLAMLGTAQAAVMQSQVVAGVELAAANRVVAASTITLGTSVATAVGIIRASVSAAILANPIGAAVLAIGAIALAIVNWETIVKASKATFDWFGNMINALSFGAQAGSIQLGKFFAQLMLGVEHSTGQITTAKYREMWAQISTDAEQATIDLAGRVAGVNKAARTTEQVAATEKFAADRKDWEKLTNTKAQQRQAEIEALNEHYRSIVIGQNLSNEQHLVEVARYNVALANINDKYSKVATKAAEKEMSDRLKLIARQYAEEYQFRQAHTGAMDSETKSIEAKTAAVLLETEAIGKTKAEIDLLQAARYDHETQIMKETLATYESAVACTVEEEALRRAIAAREAYKKAQVDQSVAHTRRAIEVNQSKLIIENIAAETKAAEEQYKMVDGFAREAFNNILDKGQNVFKSIGDAIKKYLLDMLYKMTVQKWLINVGVTGGGMGASGMANAAGTGGFEGLGGLSNTIAGGIGDLAGTVGSLFATGGGMASMAGSTALMSTAAPTLSAATLGAGSGAAAGLGSMVMTAMPYLAAAYAIYSLITADHGTPATHTGDTSANFGAGGALTGQTTWGGSNATTDKVVAGLESSYLAAAKQLGITAAATQFAYGGNTGRDGKNPMFALGGGVAGKAGFYQGETAASPEAISLAASRAVFTALQGSDLPAYLASVFSKTTHDASAMTQADITNTLAFAGALKQTREALTMQPMEIFTKSLNTSMSELGTSAATFKTDFTAAIEAGLTPETFAKWQALGGLIDQSTAIATRTRGLEITLMEAQGKSYEALSAKREQEMSAMSATDAALQKQINTAQDAVKTRGLEIQIMELLGNNTAAVAAKREIELRGLSTTDAALQMRIYALQDEAAVVAKGNAILSQKFDLEIQYANLTGDNTLARIKELQAIDPANQAMQIRIWALQDEQSAAQNATQGAQNIAAAYQDAAKSQQTYLQGLAQFGKSVKEFLIGLNTGTNASTSPESRLAATRDQYISNLSAARGGDSVAQASLTKDAQGYIDAAQAYYASGTGTQAIIAQIKSEMGGLGAATQYDANLAALKAIEAAINTSTSATQSSGSNTVKAVNALPFVITEANLKLLNSLSSNFTKLDMDLSGGLTFNEFSAGMAGKATDAAINALFKLTDTNHNGIISNIEALAASSKEAASITRSLMESLTKGTYAPMTAEQFTQAYAGTATDANLTAWFGKLDTNNDGLLSAIEIGNANTESTKYTLDQYAAMDNGMLYDLTLYAYDNRYSFQPLLLKKLQETVDELRAAFAQRSEVAVVTLDRLDGVRESVDSVKRAVVAK